MELEVSELEETWYEVKEESRPQIMECLAGYGEESGGFWVGGDLWSDLYFKSLTYLYFILIYLYLYFKKPDFFMKKEL